MDNIVIAILAKDKGFCLPFYLKCIYDQTFPKNKLHLYIRTNDNKDNTIEVLKEFIEKHGSEYASVYYDDSSISEQLKIYDHHEWNAFRFKILGKIRQESIDYAIKLNAHYFVADCDNFIIPKVLENLLFNSSNGVIAPMLNSTTMYSNYHYDIDKNGYYKGHILYNNVLSRAIKGLIDVPVIHCTYFIDNKFLKNICYDDNSYRYEYVIFSHTLRKNNIKQFLDNQDFYGIVDFSSNKEDFDKNVKINWTKNNIINLEQFEKKIYSQNGEDGVTMKLVELIYKDNTDKFYVEFGVENGNECNTKILRTKYNWNGLQMDGGNENNSINLKKEFITKENIVELFKKYKVPLNINLLSVDIDYNDFYVLNEILKVYTCDIIICEYNSSHLPSEDKIVIYGTNSRWDYTNYFGASLLSLYKLGVKYNYSLVYCDKRGVNCFFINNNIIKNKSLDFLNSLNFLNINNVDKLYKPPNYGRGPYGHVEDKLKRPYISFNNYELYQDLNISIHEKTFTEIYEKLTWGSNNIKDYNGSSGPGSSIDYNKTTYIPFLKEFINSKNIINIIDLGCGDFRCGPLIYNDLNIIYNGYDTYKKLIDYNLKQYLPGKYNFIHLDFYNKREQIICGDLCIIKDVLQHWPLEDIYIFLDYLVKTKKFKYILLINCSNQKVDNTDIKIGEFRYLSCDFLPLKKYKPVKLCNYNTKEISLIEII